MRRGGPFLACAALLACTDLGNLSGGETPDAGTTSSGEGGASPDASPGFCASRDPAITVFCDDFDAPDRVSFSQTGWQPIYAYPVGELTTSPSFSAPRAAVFRFGADDGGIGRAAAGKFITFPASKTELVVRARLFTKNGTKLGGLAVGDDACSFRWSAPNGDVSGYCNNASMGSIFTGPAAPTDTWSAVSLSVKRLPTGATLTVTVGEGPSAIAVAHDVAFAVPADGALSANPGFALGNPSSDAAGTFYYDDIAVEAR